MKIDLRELNLLSDMTDGEEWICRVADALEDGEMPSDDDIERIVDAVALLRAQVMDGDSPKQRRTDLLRKLQFPKAANREAGKLDHRGRAIAFEFWREIILNGTGVNKTLRAIAYEHNMDESTVRKNKDAFIEQGRYALNLFRGVIPEDSKAWTDAVKIYQSTHRRIKKIKPK